MPQDGRNRNRDQGRGREAWEVRALIADGVSGVRRWCGSGACRLADGLNYSVTWLEGLGIAPGNRFGSTAVGWRRLAASAVAKWSCRSMCNWTHSM